MPKIGRLHPEGLSYNYKEAPKPTKMSGVQLILVIWRRQEHHHSLNFIFSSEKVIKVTQAEKKKHFFVSLIIIGEIYRRLMAWGLIRIS